MINFIELFFKFISNLGEDVTETPVLEKNPYTIVNDLLYKDGSQVRFESTNKISKRPMDGPRFIVQHYTANNSLNGTIRVFKDYQVSAHLIVDVDGTVVQMVPFDRVAWHSGKSETRSKWGTKFTGLNSTSIGIEYINYGYFGKHVKKGTNTADWKLDVHENETSKRKWQPYTDEQLLVAEQINAAIMEAYSIPAEHIKGHDEISPNRKVDPGPLFPIDQIRGKLGDLK